MEVLGTQITNRLPLRLNGARGEEVVPTCANRGNSCDPNEKPKEKRFPLNIVDAPDLVCPMPTEYFKEST